MQNGANREKGALLESWHTNWHTSGELRLGILGIGELEYLGAEAKRARYEFLAWIGKAAPAVLGDLRRLWQSYDAVPAGEIEAWARRYHLTHQGNVPAWVAGAAAATFEAWARYPAWPADQFDLNGSIACGEILPNDIEFNGSWNPHVESLAEVTERVTERLRRLNVRPDAGEQVVKSLRTPEHFEWAVRFQVLAESVARIASQLGPDAVEERAHTIGTAVRRVLGLVQLDRRNRVGRPKNQKLAISK